MIRRPPRSTRTDTLFPYTTLFRSLALKLMRQLGPARPDDPACGQHMHEIGLHHVQQALVMGDEKHGLVGLAHDAVDAVADHPQRIDVEPAVGLVRSEERRGGTEGVSTCRSRGSRDPKKKKRT